MHNITDAIAKFILSPLGEEIAFIVRAALLLELLTATALLLVGVVC